MYSTILPLFDYIRFLLGAKCISDGRVNSPLASSPLYNNGDVVNVYLERMARRGACSSGD